MLFNNTIGIRKAKIFDKIPYKMLKKGFYKIYDIRYRCLEKVSIRYPIRCLKRQATRIELLGNNRITSIEQLRSF